MTHTTAPTGTARAGRREWTGLALLALPALLVSMDLTVLHLAVPSLSADLRPSSAELLWIVDVYGFLIAGFLVTMGTLGDRIGRRRLLLIGAAAFGMASVLAAFSTSPEMLIAARALLGVAGATLAPSTLALIRNMFHDPDQRTVAISAWFTSFLAGAALGPLVGGALLQFFWWGAAFLVGVPVMALLLVLGPSLLPEYRDPNPGRLDLASAALALAAVLGVVYGLKEFAAGGLSVTAVLVTVLGLILGVVCIRRQRSLSSPLIDLALFRSRAFSVSLGALTLSAVVMGGVGYLVAQYLQLVVGLSPLVAGLWMLIPLGAGIASMMVAPVLVHRIRPGHAVATGLAVAALGFAVVSQVGDTSRFAVVIAGLVLVFVGLMPVAALGADIVLGAAPPERAGAASAISETTQEFGLALGIALLGSIATAVYRAGLADEISATLPPVSAEAVRDTLGGATGLGHLLPEGVLATAGEAFTDGMRVAAAASAVALAIMAVVTGVALRTTSPTPDPTSTNEPVGQR